jgi:hypothetical protein
MVYRWYTKNDVISKWYTVGIPSVYFRSDCNQMVYQWYTVNACMVSGDFLLEAACFTLPGVITDPEQKDAHEDEHAINVVFVQAVVDHAYADVI